MWWCEAWKNGELIASEYEDNQEWFKSKYSEADKFKFRRVY